MCYNLFSYLTEERSLSGRLEEAQDGGGATQPCVGLFSKLLHVVMAANFP